MGRADYLDDRILERDVFALREEVQNVRASQALARDDALSDLLGAPASSGLCAGDSRCADASVGATLADARIPRCV